MPASNRIVISDRGAIRVVQFLDDRLFDDAVVREVGDQLLAAFPTSGTPTMVLDLSGVEALSSTMLVKLLLLQRRMDAAKGRLRLCEMNNTIRSVFRTSNLDRLFAIDRDLNTSLEALQEGPATT